MNDQTQEIALAKGGSKVRGPFMATCSACGGPGDKESHLTYDCFPSPYRLTGKTLGLAPRRARKSKQK
jgi:hypothetical protein